MIPVSCGDIATIVKGELVGADPSAVIDGPVVIDSRQAAPGGVFVALPGEHVDGHEYVGKATEAGVTVSLTSRAIEGSPCLVVEDPQIALGLVAKYVMSKLPGCLVIGLTGSQGKTSTKDMIAQLLTPFGPTIAPEGSFNNELGHPLTALHADENTRYLVAEMGAAKIGDIAYLAGITPPKIGIVLNVGTSHIEQFGSQDNIALGKGEMVEALPEDGTAILNADDPRVAAMADRTKARVVTFGESPNADVRATDVVLDDQARAGFTLHITGEQYAVQLQQIGEHYVPNALAAAAAAHAAGLDPQQVADGLNAATAGSKWRMEVTERPDGVTIINDAYNANPESVRAALKALAAIGRSRGARTWAVLGEMLSLGAASTELHDGIGRLAVRLDINRLIAVTEGARPIHLGANLEGSWGNESVYAEDIDAALAILRAELAPGDVVLVKASHALAFEHLAEALIKDGDTA